MAKIEQRVCIQFCVVFDKSATEALEMFREAFGVHSLTWIAGFEWYSRFKASRESVEDDRRSGRLNTNKKIANVKI
jgi:hypothetical protein